MGCSRDPPALSAGLAMPETKTPYGDVDSEALQGLRQSFDTRTILHDAFDISNI